MQKNKMELPRSSDPQSLKEIIDSTIRKNVIARSNVLEFYGAIHNVADKCNLKDVYITRDDLVWQHAWKPGYFNLSPKMIIGYDKYSSEFTHLVARQDQADFLLSAGYRKVKPIGLPVCYVPDATYPRIANSLLVMPVHSLAYTDHSHWNFREYAELINDLRKDFDHIVVCVHPSCLKKGYWADDFEKLGIEVVEGADIYDRNALLRMQFLFKSFEYVTTNSFGSHIAYASLFGSKVSVFGRFCEMKAEDFRAAKYYQDNPELVSPTLELISEKVTRANLSFLFVHPKDAVERKSWAQKEVGYDLKLSPSELKQIFGWAPIQLLKYRARNYAKAIYKGMSGSRFNFPKY